MKSPEDEARLEAIQDVYHAVLEAAGNAMQRHGNDPLGTTILAGGFTLAIRAIGDSIDPKVPEAIAMLLAMPEAKRE